MSEGIVIDVPVSIRGYVSGGKGGYGYQSSPLHRLVLRTATGDKAACGVMFMITKIAVVEGVPKPKLIQTYGVCPKCWPDLVQKGA
jgi:hypothetical protein